MGEPDPFEVWALQRAQQIVLNEGVDLMHSAQWLDKKLTQRNSARLRNAICQSLIEAMEIRLADMAEHGEAAQRKTEKAA
ncbi:hypothetical protein J5J10_07640 [Ciceribacter sp. L1K23]|uniref:hypothetical protein n=1 Tax=unclassified Ciceribacter TaxID=2628820 RepID=UPI001ABEE6EC|nr:MULTISPECIES: hypothetical protein [unclassified Ciceribacter]MBO3760325.1 hypothetical protein [Ciceribacter sp. L1K22]MBR0555551.1 hypothetical protein [Ciceribacter sp. L1K23]